MEPKQTGPQIPQVPLKQSNQVNMYNKKSYSQGTVSTQWKGPVLKSPKQQKKQEELVKPGFQVGVSMQHLKSNDPSLPFSQQHLHYHQK